MCTSWQGPFEEVFEGTKAHYLPLITCLNYLLARQERSPTGPIPGLTAAQRNQVFLAMRLAQLRTLATELETVHPRGGMAPTAVTAAAPGVDGAAAPGVGGTAAPGVSSAPAGAPAAAAGGEPVSSFEEAIQFQDSDRRLLLEGVHGMALAISTAASPVEAYSLDPKSKAIMRSLAARIVLGKQNAANANLGYDEWLTDGRCTAEEKLSRDELNYFHTRRPHAMMRLTGTPLHPQTTLLHSIHPYTPYLPSTIPPRCHVPPSPLPCAPLPR